jgi:hypothetical protein
MKIKSVSILSSALLSVLTVFVATASAQKVTVDYDDNTTFEKYHTYSWKIVKTPHTIWDSRPKTR